MRCLSLKLLAFAILQSASAQEFSAAMGRLHAIGGKESTYSWQFHYLQHFNPALTVSLGWLNEGHLPDHHRDGPVIQAWRFHRMAKNDLRLGIGLGLYRYFDTTEAGGVEGHRNRHGALPILSLRAHYPVTDGRWGAVVQLNRTLTADAPQTQAIMVGVSTIFGSPSASSRRSTSGRGIHESDQPDHTHELTFFFGRTILNSFESESSDTLESISLEYRKIYTKYIDASLTYCDEGNIDSVKRDGVTPQVWFSKRSSDLFVLSFGIGPYFSRMFPKHDNSSENKSVNIRTSMRYSMLAGIDLWRHWSVRLQWNRTLTTYHKDTDVLQVGISYKWQNM